MEQLEQLEQLEKREEISKKENKHDDLSEHYRSPGSRDRPDS